jgi:hypothetical protein
MYQFYLLAHGVDPHFLFPDFLFMQNTTLEDSVDLDAFLFGLQDRGMSPQGLDAMEGYIRSCWDKGVDVVLDTTLDSVYGSYDPHSNTLTLGQAALDCNVQLIETMEHEFIHVLQDEMDGLWNSDSQLLGLPVSDYAVMNVVNNYSSTDFETQALEHEAFSGEQLLDAGGIESSYSMYWL